MSRRTVPQPVASTLAAQILPHVKALGGTVRERADQLGVSYPVVNRFEKGVRTPTLADLESFAKTLGLRILVVRA